MCGYGGGNGWSGSGWGWGGIAMTVLIAVLVIALIVAVIVAIRYLAGGGAHTRGGSEASSAEDRLSDRFARGEIDEDEYRRRMTTLRENR